MTERTPGAPPAAPPRWQAASLTAVQQRTSRARSFFFQLERPFEFQAGQHVDVRLTAEDGYRAQRSYSIAAAPETRGPLELIIDRLEDGEVSPFFHDVAVVGDRIELRGPIGGHFVWSVADGGPLLLVAGGSGLVPLLAMLRHHVAQQATLPVLLFVSAPGWDSVICRDELLACAEQSPPIRVVLALTREPARRPGDHSRRIDASMASELLLRLGTAPERCFVCGSNPFVEAASEALTRAGVAASRIRTERYGG